jgi:hypothetical protein
VTSPPQPYRKTIVDDLDLGVTGNQVPVASTKRKAANERQRKAAAEAEAYERRRQADVERIWGRP